MQLYKSSKSGKGCAASFSCNPTEGSVFIQLIGQVSYNEETRLGAFNGGPKITIKSNVTEIGGFLDALYRNVEYSTVHKSKDAMTSIKLSPYIVDNTQKGFGLMASKKSNDGQETKLLLPINFAEIATLKTYFDFSLRQIFAAELNLKQELFKNKQSSNTSESEVE